MQTEIKVQKNKSEFALDWNLEKTVCTFKVLAFVDGKKINAFLEAHPQIEDNKSGVKIKTVFFKLLNSDPKKGHKLNAEFTNQMPHQLQHSF